MLNWSKIDSWEKFEKLSLYLSDEELKMNSLNLYLRKGYEQWGIDIKGFDFDSGLFTAIQCKYVITLSLPDLKELVLKFRNGAFYKKSNRFILITTAALCNKKIEDYINEEEEAFKKDNINFQCWDKIKISEKLQKYARIVEYFFSKDDAVNHCMRPKIQLPTIQPVPNFIERKVSLLRNRDPSDMTALLLVHNEEASLKDLLIPMETTTARICLLGEPQEGKTSLVKQLAFEMLNLPMPLVPLIVELKYTPVQAIASLLNTYHPYWTQQSFSEMALILDGLDEVAGEDFIETIKYINEFNIQYPTIRMIISCRNLFFYRYRIKEILKDFQFFELSPLSYKFIESYMQNKLKKHSERFVNIIEQNDLMGLLYKPFFLTYLTDLFAQSDKSIPESRIAILDHCINQSLEPAKARQIKRGRLFEHKTLVYRKALKKFSFGLQLASRNSFYEEEMQALLSEEELDLLQHSTLVSITQNHWSFNTALFQEHLAGSVLASFKFDEIKGFTTVGKSVCKIKTKWIQTLASTLSVLEKDDPKRATLIALIETDNVELITLTEPNQFSEKEKLEVLQKIINRYKLNNTRPIFNEIRENNIGGFCRDSDSCILLLVKTISGKIDQRIKNTCWGIIRYCSPHKKYDKDLYNLAKDEICKTADGYYANNILETMASLTIGDESLLEHLTTHPTLLKNHNYREGVYKLVISMNLTDKYYHFGLEGYAILFDYNKAISHSMSEMTLETFLLSTNRASHLRKLLLRITTEDWLNFYQYKASYSNSFLDKMTKKIIEAYQFNPLLVFPVVDFLKFVARKHSTKDFIKLRAFFSATNTNLMAIRIFFLDPDNDCQWEFYQLVDEHCFDYIFFLLEEKKITTNVLRSILGSLRHHGNQHMATLFCNAAEMALEGNLYSKEQSLESLEYQKQQETKIANDKEFIKTLQSFREGIIKYFNDFGKKTANFDELYIDNESREKRKAAASNFTYNFLVARLRKSNIVYLKDCLAFLKSGEAFEDFRATQLLHYNHSREEVPEFIELLASYYSKYITSTDFTNAIYQRGDRTYIKHRPSILADIFFRFKFETPQHILPELLWLDRSTNRDQKKDTLTSTVMERLDKEQKANLPVLISSRIRLGIVNQEVLENHLELCRTCRFTNVVPQILELISQKRLEHYYYNDATMIYRDLGGSIEELIPIYRSIVDFTKSYFWYLSDLLYEFQNKVVKERLYECLRACSNLTIQVDAAKRLADMGEKFGFSFLMEKLKSGWIPPITIQASYKLYNVDTDFALDEMNDMCHLVLEGKEDDDIQYHTSPGRLLLEVLYGLALKNEDSLLKVDRFLRQNFKKLKTSYNNAKDLLWYAERNLEEYRKSDSEFRSVEKIKEILSSVS